MKTFLNFIKIRIREIFYVFVSLPVSVFLFTVVMVGFSSGIFLPLAVLLFLFMLTVMERIALFEIWRTNKILATEITAVPMWFKQPFFSWAGAKERVTSLRSWMAVGYVFAIFGLSIFAFVVLTFGLAGLLTIAVAIGLIVLSNFDKSFSIKDGGDSFSGSFQFFGSSSELRFEFGDAVDRGYFVYHIDSMLSVILGFGLIVLALWSLPRIVRSMIELVEGLLAGGAHQEIEATLRSKISGINKQTVRSAIADEVARPELAELSKREREILALMAEGKSNSGIAKALYITEGSVEKHISNILSKLGLSVEEDSHRRVLAVLTYLGLNK